MTTDTIAALEGVRFPGSDPRTHNRNLRALLRQAEPLVSKGKLESVKKKVAHALARPLDDTQGYARELYWALHASWPYVHWDENLGDMPAARERMQNLYRAMWNTSIYPFTTA